MAFKVLPDANFLLDLILKRSDDYNDLSRIYNKIVDGSFKGFSTTSILQTTGYWLEKAIGFKSAKEILIITLHDLKIIDAPHNVIEEALHSGMKDIEDSFQYYVALHHQTDVIISRDKDFIKSAKSILPVLHPKEFIKQYINEV